MYFLIAAAVSFSRVQVLFTESLFWISPYLGIFFTLASCSFRLSKICLVLITLLLFLASLFPQSFRRHLPTYLPTQTILLLLQVDVSFTGLIFALCYFRFSDFLFHLYVRVFLRFVLSCFVIFIAFSRSLSVCICIVCLTLFITTCISLVHMYMHLCVCLSLSILLIHHHTYIRIMLLCSIIL